MPQVINTLVLRIWTLIREFFRCNDFDYGNIEVLANANPGQWQTIFVKTENPCQRVFFSIEGSGGEGCGNDPFCAISDPSFDATGFSFKIKVSGNLCNIKWFATL
jgi:hypothetical protein